MKATNSEEEKVMKNQQIKLTILSCIAALFVLVYHSSTFACDTEDGITPKQETTKNDGGC